MKKRIAIFPILVFSFLLNIKLSGQVASIEFSEKLYLNQEYEYALKEYLRVYYTQKGNTSDVLLKISNLYVLLKNTEKSLKYADLIYFGNEDLELRNEAIKLKIQIYLKSEDYESALVNANQLKIFDTVSADSKLFFTGICHLWQKTPKIIENDLLSLSYLTQNDKKILAEKLASFQKAHNKNPYAAMIYSAIIPGLGQALNGNPVDGLKSFLLMGTLSLIFIEVIQVLSMGDAIVSVSPWLIRYFTGGMINASKQAKKKIKEQKTEQISEILKYLSNINSMSFR